MKKILLVATVQSHIAQFHKPLINMLKEQGYEVHVAARNNLKEKNGLKIEKADRIFDICFSRSPFHKNNIEAYKQLKKIMIENQYDVVHCNTPMGGVLTRLVRKKCKNIKSKIIYTVHGFHFYKGAPLINWLLYYPIEKYFSKYTDCLITINQEDYERAKYKLKMKKVNLVHGVGISSEKFQNLLSEKEKIELRQKLGLTKEDFIIIQIGELNKNKNQIMSFKAMRIIASKYDHIKLIILGNGPLKEKYEEEIKKMQLTEHIKLLGYRLDIPQLMQISNLEISTSKREGLPVNVMEAMESGVPSIVTDCRGNRDLIQNGENGYIVKIQDFRKLANKIIELYHNPLLLHKMGQEGEHKIKDYEEDNVIKEMREIYQKIFE